VKRCNLKVFKTVTKLLSVINIQVHHKRRPTCRAVHPDTSGCC